MQIVSELLPLIHQVSATDNLIVDVLAWLCFNTIKSNRLQSLQLCQQNVTTIVRKRALSSLLQKGVESADASGWTGVFREPLERGVRDSTEPGETALTRLEGRISAMCRGLSFSPSELEELADGVQKFRDNLGVVPDESQGTCKFCNATICRCTFGTFGGNAPLYACLFQP